MTASEAERGNEFARNEITLLSAGNELTVLPNSKKDPETRAKELLTATSPSLIEQVAENTGELMREKMSSQAVREIMLHATGDKTAAVDAILKLCSENIEKENHIVEHRFANRVLKALIKADTAEASDDRGKNGLLDVQLLTGY
jgi:pumilio family protein 6